MPRFHFHLRAGGTIRRDPNGTECADSAAVRSHAIAVATELMRNSGSHTRIWSLRVEDEGGEVLFDLFFADLDRHRGSLPAEFEELTAKTCRRHGALIDTISAARATMIESRMLIARATGKPQLVHRRKA